MVKYAYKRDTLDELHEDLYESKYETIDFSEFYGTEEERLIKIDAEEKEMDVIRYKEKTDDEEYNKIAAMKIEMICNYCINKIIELHNGKPIVLDEDEMFTNSCYASYYCDVIEDAYDVDTKAVVKMINKFYVCNSKKR